MLLVAGCGAASVPGAAPAAVPAVTPAAEAAGWPVEGTHPPRVAGLPPIPFFAGAPSIDVVHPQPGMMRPNVRSVFVYGSVGTGAATLSINDLPVEVAPNGAFIGYVPRPANDTLRLVAHAEGWVGQMDVWYSPPRSGGGAAAPPPTVEYDVPRAARVSAGGDTLATGSDVSVGRPTPAGTYRWFLPRGSRLSLTGERAGQVRARMGAEVAWFPASAVTLESDGPTVSGLGTPVVVSGDSWSDVHLPIAGAPFRFEGMDSLLVVELHGVTAAFQRVQTTDAIVPLVEVVPQGPEGVTVRIHPGRRIWGFKAFYDPAGTLVVRVRRPPDVDPVAPLTGIRVVVDPGHPPGGATGPTGLYEGDANLAIGLRLADLLRERGAEVLLTRSTPEDVSLGRRVGAAVAEDGHLLVSVHNNAFAEGANPFAANGTSTYYFHQFSRDLAAAINDEIVSATLTRDLGEIHGNLALARPTWMPSVLTESLFMPIPAHEAALRDPEFIDRLAAAHVRGLERFLLQSTGSALDGN